RRAEVHRHAYVVVLGQRGRHALDAEAREDVLALLGEPVRQDLHGTADGAVREVPARERLDPDGLGRAEADDGLVLEAQFVQRGHAVSFRHYAAPLRASVVENVGAGIAAASRCPAAWPVALRARAGSPRRSARRSGQAGWDREDGWLSRDPSRPS